MRHLRTQPWLPAALAAALWGCAGPRPFLNASEHAARPIPSHSSHSSSHHHSSRSSGSSDDDSWIGDCLGVLCDIGAAAADAAADDDDDDGYDGPQPDDGSTYLDPPDPILVDAAQTPPAPPDPQAARPASPPPAAQPVAASPSPAPQAVLAVAPSDTGRAQELAADITLAQNQLRNGERAAFVARFSTRADRELVASQPGRDLAGELAGARSEALLRQLDACHTWGVQLDGDEATCGGAPHPLRWHLEPQGWSIEDLATPATH